MIYGPIGQPSLNLAMSKYTDFYTWTCGMADGKSFVNGCSCGRGAQLTQHVAFMLSFQQVCVPADAFWKFAVPSACESQW